MKKVVMNLVKLMETVKNDKTIIQEEVEIKDKHKLTLVNILNEMEAKKRKELIKKKV
jgi:hypothetical protein